MVGGDTAAVMGGLFELCHFSAVSVNGDTVGGLEGV
jgi:hypothetical protein